MDDFEIRSARSGILITLRSTSRDAPSCSRVRALKRRPRCRRESHERCERGDPATEPRPAEEPEELRLRQEELTRLNAELEDTNRGVVNGAVFPERQRAAHPRARTKPRRDSVEREP
jgi:hypothetical protein